VRNRHFPEQVAAELRQAEAGTPVAEIVRKLGIHENTFSTWKRQFGGLETQRLGSCASLREENAKLKSIVADLSLDRKTLQEIIAKSCEAGASARTRRLSDRDLRCGHSLRVRRDPVRIAQPTTASPKRGG
jgi:putative transposase